MKNTFTPINIISFHNSEYTDRPKMQPHHHKKAELVYIAEGRALLSFAPDSLSALKTYECTAGQFALFKPNTPHAIDQVGSFLKVYNLQLDTDGSESLDFAELLSISSYVRKFPTAVKLLGKWEDALIFTDTQNIAHILGNFKNYSSSDPDVFYYANAELDLKRLFIEVIKCSHESLESRGQSVYIRKTVQYLEAHYNTCIDYSELLSELGISQSYLQKLFKLHFGETITQRLSSIRIRRAKQLLTETNLTISDIAKMCGFNSFQAFDISFKKSEGIPPLEYRRSEPKKHIAFYKDQ